MANYQYTSDLIDAALFHAGERDMPSITFDKFDPRERVFLMENK